MINGPIDISVLVPVLERPEPLDVLYREFSQPLRDAGYRPEFIFALQPHYSGLIPPLRELARQGEPVRVIEFGHGVSETAMLKVAAVKAHGGVLMTIPAYRQVEAAALPALVRQVEEGIDLAVARRWPRRDSLVNRIQNRGLHVALGGLGGGRFHDVACGVRAMQPKVLDETRVYGDFFRFFPLLAQREGFSVTEVNSPIHQRAMRGRMYGFGTYLRRIIDVVGLIFLLRFTDKPLRFFGLIGSVLGIIGGIILTILLIGRQAFGWSLANRPMLLLGVLLVTVGIQAIALGLIGEMIVHLHASRRPLYRLRERRQSGPTARSLVSDSGAEVAVVERDTPVAALRGGGVV